MEITNKAIICTFEEPTEDQQLVVKGIADLLNIKDPLVVLKHTKVSKETVNARVVISLGLISARLLANKLSKEQILVKLPALKELLPKEENRETRELAAQELAKVNDLLKQDSVEVTKIKIKKEEIKKIEVPESLLGTNKLFRVVEDGRIIEVSQFQPKDKKTVHLTIEELYIATKLFEITEANEIEIENAL